jgi:signal transduction histidine kinase
MPIRQRLFFIFSTALLLMMLLLAGYIILTVQRHLEGQEFQRMKTLARDLAQRNRTHPEAARSLAEESVFLNGYQLFFTGVDPVPFGRAVAPDSFPLPQTLQAAAGNALVTFSDEVHLVVAIAWEAPSGVLLVVQQRREVGAALRPIRHIVYTGMLISLLLIFAVSAFTSRSLARPIKQIADAAEAIASGDRSRSLSLDRNDEFGRMAASLNRMAGRLLEESDIQRSVNERLRGFQSDLAHEIRNPLHAMNASLDMLALDNLPPESRARHEHIVRTQSARLNRLFTDLLTLQKFDAPQSPLALSPVSLRPMLEHLALLHHEALQEKKMQLVFDEVDALVLAHPDRLEQVLDNLISNAIKFTKEGEIRIQTIVSGSEIEVHVLDSGPGIPTEHLDRIFDRFYRVDPSRDRNSGGTGLGLAVVKTLLEAQGSRIFVRNRPEGGADFYFRLKRADA